MKKKLIVLMIALLTIGQLEAEGTAKIIILRPFDFGAAMGAAYGGKKFYAFDHYIDFDGQLFGNVASMTYYEILVEPGNHTIIGFVGQQGPDNARAEGQKYSLVISAAANMTYYACINETKMTLSLIDEKKWNKELKKANPVKWIAKVEFKDDVFYDSNGTPIGGDMQMAKTQTAQNQPGTATSSTQPKKERVLSDVDQNIPQTKGSADETFVLIVANEDYEFLDDVNYASYDGETFKEYCIKTLGVPERQIR